MRERKRRTTPHVCQQCGKCCRILRITFDEDDVNREPRLLKVAIPIEAVRKNRTARFMREKGHPYAIKKPYPGAPCVFLDRFNNCVIHATRPQICRDYPGEGYCLREKENYGNS